MLRIEFNQNLFDTHIDKISESIKKLNTNGLKRTLNSEDKECLEFIERNIEKILSATPKNLKNYIALFSICFPNSIGIQNQKEENWKPLTSSYTQSNTSDNTGKQPLADGDISESGEKTRAAESNSE